MTETHFSRTEAHVIAFPGSVSLLLGVYPPIYRVGENVFKGHVEGTSIKVDVKDIQTKEWLKNEVKEGHLMLLESQVAVKGEAVVMCLPPTLTPFFSGLEFSPVRKTSVQAAVIELVHVHHIMWEAIRACQAAKRTGLKELYACQIICSSLVPKGKTQLLASMAKKALSKEDYSDLRSLLRVNASHFGFPPPDLGR